MRCFNLNCSKHIQPMFHVSRLLDMFAGISARNVPEIPRIVLEASRIIQPRLVYGVLMLLFILRAKTSSCLGAPRLLLILP